MQLSAMLSEGTIYKTKRGLRGEPHHRPTFCEGTAHLLILGTAHCSLGFSSKQKASKVNLSMYSVVLLFMRSSLLPFQ